MGTRKRIVDKQRLACVFCDFKCAWMQGMEFHLRYHIKEKPWFCKLCDKECYSKYNELRVHTLMHEGLKPVQCSKCDKTFRQKGTLQIHMKLIHSEARPFRCHICDKTFKIKALLRVHSRTHTVRRPHKCQHCGSKFKNKRILRGHILSFHVDNKDRPFKCDICDRGFAFSGRLKEHMRTHVAKSHKCDICGDLFSSEAVLKKHLTTHKEGAVYKVGREVFHTNWREPNNKRRNPAVLTEFTLVEDEATLSKIIRNQRIIEPKFEGQEYIHGVKNEDNTLFRCSYSGCSSVFTTQMGLTSHSRVHWKKIDCPHCGMMFKIAEDRDKHTAEFHHSDGNPLQCKKCGTVKQDRKNFRRHARDTHGGTPVQCSLCSSVMKSAFYLGMHMRYKHAREKEGIIYSCDSCDKVYLSKAELRRHVNLYHRGDSKQYTCILCKTTTYHKMTYWRHLDVHAQGFYCFDCQVNFGTEPRLRAHLASCNHETEIGSSLTNAKKPEVVTSNEKLVELARNVKVQVSLHRVDERVVKRVPPPKVNAIMRQSEHYLKCTYCDDKLPNLEAVKNHEKHCVKLKTSLKLHVCTICRKEFSTKHDFERHLRSHSNEKTFPCSYCDMMFKNKGCKVRHEKALHFGIRTSLPNPTGHFECNYENCSKVFRQKKSLNSHVKGVHLKIPHPCEQCDKVFARGDALRNHVRVEHATDKPTLLLCRPCKRAFKCKTTYVNHFRTQRHQRKTQELCQQFGNKQEMAEIMGGGHALDVPQDEVAHYPEESASAI